MTCLPYVCKSWPSAYCTDWHRSAFQYVSISAISHVIGLRGFYTKTSSNQIRFTAAQLSTGWAELSCNEKLNSSGSLSQMDFVNNGTWGAACIYNCQLAGSDTAGLMPIKHRASFAHSLSDCHYIFRHTHKAESHDWHHLQHLASVAPAGDINHLGVITTLV